MGENSHRRLKRIEACLTWSPLPKNAFDWSREPALHLLTERQSDALHDLFGRISESVQFGHSLETTLNRLPERDVRLLEVFVDKTAKAKAITKARQLNSPSARAA